MMIAIASFDLCSKVTDQKQNQTARERKKLISGTHLCMEWFEWGDQCVRKNEIILETELEHFGIAREKKGYRNLNSMWYKS